MNLGIYDVVIDFSKLFVHNTTSISFKEGDLNTAKIKARLNMQGKVIDITGCSVAVKIETINGVKITDTATIIDPVNGIVEIDFKSNSIVKGTNFFELWIIKDDSVKKSPRLGYRVLDSIDDAGAIEGTNEYPILISLISDANKAIQDAKEALNIANTMQIDITDAIDNAYRSANEADIATSNANTKIEEVETTKTEMIKKVDTSIVTMKSEVETAKNEMASKADEKIADVDRALAAGTVDLEVKQARKDASGVIHDTIKQRLDSDLIVGDKSLKDFVIDMNGMKESQDLAYETNNSYQVCTDTQVGVVKDLKVYGVNMIQLVPNGKRENAKVIDSYYGSITVYTPNIVQDKTYTLIYIDKVKESSTATGTIGSVVVHFKDGTHQEVSVTKDVGIHAYITIKNKSIDRVEYRYGRKDTKHTTTLDFEMMFIEGTIDYLPPYFEGMASVGNGTPLEVTTRNMAYDYTVELVKNVRKNFKLKEGFFEGDVIKNISDKSVIALVFDSTTLVWLRDATLNKGDSYTVPMGSVVKTITIYPHNGWNLESEIYLEQLVSVDGILKLDKKPILYKDSNGAWNPVMELNGINDNNRDIVDTTINQYIEKTVKLLIDKDFRSTHIRIMADYGDVTRIDFTTNILNVTGGYVPLMCDKFKQIAISTPNEEGVNIHATEVGRLQLQIKTNKLPTKDVQGVISYLTNNPFEVVLPLAKANIYELNPIYPDSFEGETMVMIKGGLLPIKASFKVTSSLPNFVKELSNQIKQLQDQVYKTNVANFTVALNTLDTKLRLDRLEAPQQ